MGKHRGRGSSANALKKSFSTKKPDDKRISTGYFLGKNNYMQRTIHNKSAAQIPNIHEFNAKLDDVDALSESTSQKDQNDQKIPKNPNYKLSHNRASSASYFSTKSKSFSNNLVKNRDSATKKLKIN